MGIFMGELLVSGRVDYSKEVSTLPPRIMEVVV